MNLNPLQLDALTEVINIGVGHAAGAINDLVGAHVTLRVPDVHILNLEETRDGLDLLGWDLLSAVQLDFSGLLKGNSALVFPCDSATKFVSLLTGDEAAGQDMAGLRSATLSEVGNILLNGVVGAISNLLGSSIQFSLPSYSEDLPKDFLAGANPGQPSTVIFARTRFLVAEHQIEGEILIFLELGALEGLLAALDAMSNPPVENA